MSRFLVSLFTTLGLAATVFTFAAMVVVFFGWLIK